MAISVISLFVLLTKLIAAIMHIWYPLFALLFNVALTALYAVSVYGQAGPDYADPDRPSPAAWYIAKPCDVAANQKVQSSCRLAKGTFAATVIMLCVHPRARRMPEAANVLMERPGRFISSTWA